MGLKILFKMLAHLKSFSGVYEKNQLGYILGIWSLDELSSPKKGHLAPVNLGSRLLPSTGWTERTIHWREICLSLPEGVLGVQPV